MMLDPTIPTVDEAFDREREQERLAAILGVVYLLMLRRTHQLVTAAFDLDPLIFRINRADIARQLELAVERAALITGTTHDALSAILAEGRAAGLTQAEMVAALDHLYRVTFAPRPAMQAVNEAHAAMLVNAQDRYRASGLVEFQEIRDGDYDRPCADRNGAVVPITTRVEQYHPFCRVVTRPVRAAR